ncbi:MAG: hypothetical protein ACXVWZ_14885 [Nocardioides sp.]
MPSSRTPSHALVAPVGLGTLVAAFVLGACQSGHDDRPAAAPKDTPTSSPTSSPSTTAPAVALAHPGVGGAYCSTQHGDTLWSGTQLRARADATLDHVTARNAANIDVADAWVVEDRKDDGLVAPWRTDGRRFLRQHAPAVGAAGASLKAGTTYRLVLRLSPVGPPPAEVDGFDVSWTGADGSTGGLHDDQRLTFVARDAAC